MFLLLPLILIIVIFIFGFWVMQRYYERRHVEDLHLLFEEFFLLQKEQELAQRLLLNVLPAGVVKKLLKSNKTLTEHFDNVTILFGDIVGFTELADKKSPAKIVEMLDDIFSKFDILTEKYKLEKIKTIGDAYMAVGGIEGTTKDHATACAKMAQEMLQVLESYNKKQNLELALRVGINSGPAVAGVIGKKKFIYDLWGDSVNTASRMESHSLPGKIQITETTLKQLSDDFSFEERGRIKIKGKGELRTYFLNS